jgi:hypothetical protein
MPFSFRSLAAGLLTAALLVGCGSSAVVSEPEPTTVYPGAPGTISRTEASQAAPMAARSAYVEADVRFMQDMIHHHTQALEMAALVPERTTREDIRRLAQRIEVSQYDEIELMRRWLTDRGEVAVEAHGGHGHTSPAERPPDHPPEHDAHHDHHQHHHAAPAVDPHAGMKLNEPGEALLRLPCGDGPAQLAEDAACVVCRGKSGATTIVNLISGKTTAVDVPSATAQVTGMGLERRLVWADPNGVWMAMPAKPKEARKVAPEPPLRGFLPSPDGTRAAGVYADHVFQGARNKQPGEVLMTFALDGDGARRKAIQRGIPVAWSHDSQWLLVQDGSSACVMRAVGGDYKCWRGYTAASLSPDGRYALLLGNRRDEAKPDPKARKPVKGGKPDPRAKKPAKPPAKSAPPPPEEPPDAEPEGDEHGDGPAPPDVPVPAPSGPLSLYRASIDGAFTAAPQLVARIVDGGVVWVPRAP